MMATVSSEHGLVGGAQFVQSLFFPAIIHRVLYHRKLPLELPSVAPSRAPPESSIPF